MNITLKNKEIVAQDTLRLEFELPEFVHFNAGQYSSITIPYLRHPDKKGNMRLFSFVNSPTDNTRYVITTRFRGSGFKEALYELKLGAQVEMGGVGGDFVLPDETDKPLVFIAGGIGITPYMSMLSYVFENNLLYNITLLYSNRDRASTAYFDWLQKMDQEHDNFRAIFVMTQDSLWEGESRHIDTSFVREYFPDYMNNVYYVVGPPKMSESVEGMLSHMNIDDEQIIHENFGGY